MKSIGKEASINIEDSESDKSRNEYTPAISSSQKPSNKIILPPLRKNKE